VVTLLRDRYGARVLVSWKKASVGRHIMGKLVYNCHAHVSRASVVLQHVTSVLTVQLTSIYCIHRLIIIFSYNALASKPPEMRWKIRVAVVARCFGAYKMLVKPQSPAFQSGEAAMAQPVSDQGPNPSTFHPPKNENLRNKGNSKQQIKSPADVIGDWMSRIYSSIDLEKSDIVAALTLVSVMQCQQRRALAAVRFKRAHVDLKEDVCQVLRTRKTECGMDAIQEGPREGGSLYHQTISLLKEECQRQSEHGEREHEAGYHLESQNPDEAPRRTRNVVLPDRSSPFWRWLEAVSTGSDMMLSPPRWAASAAPHLTPQTRAALLSGVTATVDPDVLLDAAHWAVHAAAAYGKQSFISNAKAIEQYSAFRARIKLYKATLRKRRAIRNMPEPLRSTLKGRKQLIAHFVGGQRVAHVCDEDVLYCSFVNQPLGSTPYFIVRDRKRKCLVLSIRGTASFADLATDLVSTPTDFLDWLPDRFVREKDLKEAKAHGGILAAAKAVLTDLNRHQILHILLLGHPQSPEDPEESEEDPNESKPHLTPAEYQKLLQDRDINVVGWPLIVCGHSLGAAIGSFLAPFFMEWVPKGLHVWAFNPPGGLMTQAVADAISPVVTSILLGKDIISRTSSANLELLLDQAVVALGLTRLCKTRILLRLRSQSLRSNPPSEVFYRIDEAPEEALKYLYEYFVTKCRYLDDMLAMMPPGQCIYLRRLKPSPSEIELGKRRLAALNEARVKAGMEAGRETPPCWEAVWIEREMVMKEGILLSRHQTSDHYTQTLMRALGDVAQKDVRELLLADAES
jgi:hypothetical protein